MLVTVNEIRELADIPESWSDKKVKMKLDAIEQAIRSYTSNNFQVRTVRSICSIENGKLLLHGITAGFAVGDTVQLTESGYNNGLYVISQIDGKTFSVDFDRLTDEGHALVTKVEYPADVIQCAVDLMEWDVNYRGKVGIKSETLSRHSVTYAEQDANNMVMGYPVSIMSVLNPAYMKARF